MFATVIDTPVPPAPAVSRYPAIRSPFSPVAVLFSSPRPVLDHVLAEVHATVVPTAVDAPPTSATTVWGEAELAPPKLFQTAVFNTPAGPVTVPLVSPGRPGWSVPNLIAMLGVVGAAPAGAAVASTTVPAATARENAN